MQLVATYAIGDIQGCYSEFRRLLDEIDFVPSKDRLLLLGDLVNRGNESLSVIRFAMKHQQSVDVVLGNHDLFMLSVLEEVASIRPGDTFSDVLDAPDREEIHKWLCHRPLAIHNSKLNYLAVHAGVHPRWNLSDTLNHAAEIETMLQSKDRKKLFRKMFGNRPSRWSESLSGWKRLRFILNVLTRMRFISIDERLNFVEMGTRASSENQLVRWFDFPNRIEIEPTVVFGHWSSLGVFQSPGILAMDSGCCWGRCLSAARLDAKKPEIIQVNC